VAGKAGYALSCVAAALVLAVSGFSYFVVHDVSSIGGSHAIDSGPSIGAQNILLMGLESRTDWNGNVLPNDILNALHAGSRQGVLYEGVGGNATNTLILIHIPAGGKKAIGFSIPRDDWVTFPTAYDNQSQGKIDQAYGLALAAKESELRQQHPGMSQSQVAFGGNEAAAPPRSRPWNSSPGCTSTTSPRSTWTGSTSWPRCSAACRSASSARSRWTPTPGSTPSGPATST
jgi:anionic cell wall polymer biosynthesis LytR-Cps2A-Psr (LCP) family protein